MMFTSPISHLRPKRSLYQRRIHRGRCKQSSMTIMLLHMLKDMKNMQRLTGRVPFFGKVFMVTLSMVSS